MPYCMNCGFKLPDSAKFCYKCGHVQELIESDMNTISSSLGGKHDYDIVKIKADAEKESQCELHDMATLHGVADEVLKREAKYRSIKRIDESTHINRSTNISNVNGPVFKEIGSGSTLVGGDLHFGLDEKGVSDEIEKQIGSLKEDPDDYYNRGIQAFLHGDYSNAKTLFGKSSQLDPNAYQTKRFLAFSYMAGQKLKYMAPDDVHIAEKLLLQIRHQESDDIICFILLAALKHDYYMENAFPQKEPKFDVLQYQLKTMLRINPLTEKDKKLFQAFDFSQSLKQMIKIEDKDDSEVNLLYTEDEVKTEENGIIEKRTMIEADNDVEDEMDYSRKKEIENAHNIGNGVRVNERYEEDYDRMENNDLLQHIIRGISSDCAHLFNQTSDIYDYPVFYDWGMDEWRDGVERKTLMDKYENKKSNKNERAIVKWDYFYKYSKYRMVKCKDNYFQELEDVYHRKETDRHLRISKLRGENDRNKSVKKELIINKIKFLIISFLLIALFGVGLILLIGFTIWIIIKYKHINEKIQENNNEILTRNRDGERLLQQLKNHKQEIENLIPQMEKQYNQQRIVVNEETIEQWHMEELKELEKNALSELGIEIDNVDIQEAISYATERGMKAYQGFKSLFIEGAGMLQELHTPGIDLFHENKEMKTFVIEERIHFRVTYNQFIVPTRHKLCSYRFFYDCIDGRVRGKRTEEYYYEDVVMITTSHETRDFPLAVSDIDKKQEFFTFIMSLKSGEKIMVSLSDHGLVELISERLHAVDEPLVKEIIIINSKNGKYQDELYEIDSRSEEEAKLIVKNIRTQLAKIKKGTGVVRSGTWK